MTAHQPPLLWVMHTGKEVRWGTVECMKVCAAGPTALGKVTIGAV